MRGYRLRPNWGGNKKASREEPSGYSVTVPGDIGRLVPDDAEFDCELHQDGILFRLRKDDPPAGLPDWVKR